MRSFLWTALRLALLALALMVVAGLSAFLTIQYVTSTRSVTVPDLSGLSATEATSRLNDLELRIELVEDANNAFDEQVPAGRVLRQEPAAGTRLKQNRRVRVTLSLGPRQLYLPKVAGEQLSVAQARLEEAGLRVGEVVYAPSASVPENRVIDAEPAGDGGSSGTADVLVSSGPPPRAYLMPDLIGRRGTQVSSWLELKGFAVQVAEESYEGVPPGTVVRQKPLGGSPVRLGDTLWVWTSRAAAGLPRAR